MKNSIKTLLFTTIISTSLTAYANGYAPDNVSSATDRHAYIGIEYGLAEPIVKSFEHEESKTKIRLKQSRMYGARVGYSFYPGMMVELTGSHQNSYKLTYQIPEKPVNIAGIPAGFSIPVTNGSTKVTANVFMANFIYEMQKMTPLEVSPYFLFGAGVAQVSVKSTYSNWKLPSILAGALGKDEATFFKVTKNNQNCFAWQVGLGLKKELMPNLSLDFGAKMRVVNDIKIKYQKIVGINTFESPDPIKKTIGIGEFTVGLTYKIPM